MVFHIVWDILQFLAWLFIYCPMNFQLRMNHIKVGLLPLNVRNRTSLSQSFSFISYSQASLLKSHYNDNLGGAASQMEGNRLQLHLFVLSVNKDLSVCYTVHAPALTRRVSYVSQSNIERVSHVSQTNTGHLSQSNTSKNMHMSQSNAGRFRHVSQSNTGRVCHKRSCSIK